MAFLRKSLKNFTTFIIVFCFCILTGCSLSDNLHQTDSSETKENTTISDTQIVTSEEIPVTSEDTTAITEEPQPHVVSWLDPTDAQLYNFTPQQKQVYNVMMEGIKSNIPNIAMPCKISYDEVEKIFAFVRNNLYEYCHLKLKYGYKLSDGYVTSIALGYKYDASQVEIMKNELSAKADSILSNFYEGMPEWDKIKYIHDYIVLNCTYDAEGANNQSAYGALIDGKAVCEGYAKAMAYLCNKAGIECMLVTGYAGGDAHMWNMVKYNGNWYHIDATWDDPAKMIDGTEYVKYNYFNLTTSQIRLDHKIIPDNNFVEYPQAVANEGNYFIKKGAYIKTFDEAEDILIKQISSGADNNKKYISVRVATQTLYNDIFNKIIKSNEIINLLSKANDITNNKFDIYNCSYSVQEDSYIINIII